MFAKEYSKRCVRLKERERERGNLAYCIDRVEISRINAQGVCGGVSNDYVTFSM